MIPSVTPDPRQPPVLSMQLVFSEAIVGLDLADLSLRRNGGTNLLTVGQNLTTSDQTIFTLDNLGVLTALPGRYELSLRAFGAQIADAANNRLVAGAFAAFQVLADPDLNGDAVLDCADVDALVAALAAGSSSPIYDINGDGRVDRTDLSRWLGLAGAANLASGNSYLPGDANLDGAVDVSDFNRWNANKFTVGAGWCGGDFNADGSVDVSDFNIWNAQKFQVALGPVPSLEGRRDALHGRPQAAQEASFGMDTLGSCGGQGLRFGLVPFLNRSPRSSKEWASLRWSSVAGTNMEGDREAGSTVDGIVDHVIEKWQAGDAWLLRRAR